MEKGNGIRNREQQGMKRNGVLWVEKHGSKTTTTGLAVNQKKVEEVKVWMEKEVKAKGKDREKVRKTIIERESMNIRLLS